MKALKMILSLLLGAAIGFGSIMLIVWLIDMGKKPTSEKSEKTIDWLLMFGSIGLSILFLFVSAIVHTILHEAGHLVAGLATGYKFLSYRAFKWMIVRENDRLKLKKYNVSGTLGQCIMIPPTTTESISYFWYNAGGIIVNIVLVTISIIILRTFNLGMVGMSAWMMMAFVGLFMTLTNGIPYAFNGANNDGCNILMLKKKPARRKSFATMLLVAAELSQGTRMKDMPRDWFINNPITDVKDLFQLSDRMMYMSLQEDLGNYDEARIIAEEISAFGDKTPSLFRMETEGEHTMLELMTTNRQEVVESLWTKQLEAYTKNSSKYSPIKLSVLYAYELLYNADVSASLTYLEKLRNNKEKFANPGETLLALELCEKIHALGDRN